MECAESNLRPQLIGLRSYIKCSSFSRAVEARRRAVKLKTQNWPTALPRLAAQWRVERKQKCAPAVRLTCVTPVSLYGPLGTHWYEHCSPFPTVLVPAHSESHTCVWNVSFNLEAKFSVTVQADMFLENSFVFLEVEQWSPLKVNRSFWGTSLFTICFILGSCLLYSQNLKMEVAYSSETSVAF